MRNSHQRHCRLVADTVYGVDGRYKELQKAHRMKYENGNSKRHGCTPCFLHRRVGQGGYEIISPDGQIVGYATHWTWAAAMAMGLNAVLGNEEAPQK